MKKLLALLAFTLFSFTSANAQYSLNSYATGSPVLDTYSELMNGQTQANQVTVQIQRYSGDNNITQWRLTARLLQDYEYGAYSVGAQYSFLRFSSQQNNSSNSSSISISSQPVQLNKFNEVTLIESNVPLTNTVSRTFNFDLMIQGGNHLLTIPNATYNSAYEFKLYRISNGVATLVRTSTQSVGNSARFQIEYSMNNSQSVTLQNGANLVNLQFSSAADYASGKSVSIPNGLRVNSYFSDYQLAVKASGNFTSTTSSATIPISVLKAELTTNSNYPGLQISSPITMSTSDQIMAIRSYTFLWYSTITYNLRFYIPANSPGLNVAPGTYTTYVYFVITPN